MTAGRSLAWAQVAWSQLEPHQRMCQAGAPQALLTGQPAPHLKMVLEQERVQADSPAVSAVLTTPI